jgi:flagellar hook-associated protein 1 FlgK
LVNEFNQQHQAGFALDGTTNNPFFSALTPLAPVARDTNSGTAVGTSVAITDPTLLTFQNYEVQFSSASAFSIINAANGTTVTTGSYTSGAAINFDGIDVVVTGAAATGDVFSVSVQKGAAQQFGLALTNVDKVAASSTALGVPGNNVNALALVNLHTSRQSTLGNLTFNDYHTITTGNVGSATREAELLLNTTSLEFEQLKGLRESVSGVSLDEELTNLLSFQRSFEASARMITVADELFQTILTMGR